ncbi:hypothetical protein [Streptomyces sp. NBC_00525]|uniref:hypothetical protein n=1 Tax=Streptomyces sp. NBC_00525 TaxID=2903660 RepID=UPI002E80499B|nr:hypothetical protein [Streptomyces sp. NBC_00525]WUC98058.1 hypothetical protein OG710_30795 [Streptomyces sp. NBC_00525]
MTRPMDRDGSRRAANSRKRQSRRPSRLGLAAGATPKPDRVREEDAGFPGLLARVWGKASAAAGTRAALDILLTLDGHVPAEVQTSALRIADAAALKVLAGLTADTDAGVPSGPVAEPAGRAAFLGEIGLTTSGRVVVRVPSQPPLAKQHTLVGGVLRVPWAPRHLEDYRREVERARERFQRDADDSRRWLAEQGPEGRAALLEQLTEGARRTAPFMLYIEDKQYTNFRDTNTVVGKTLWPGHPDCVFGSLSGLPLELWSDHDVLLVVCIGLLIRSAGYGRIEEVNGSQLTPENVGRLLEQTRRNYNGALGGERIAAAGPDAGVDALTALATELGAHRPEVARTVQLYREIHGTLIHKVEKVAAPYGEVAADRDRQVTEHLRATLPVTGDRLAGLRLADDAGPSWLARPYGEFGTGLEAVVYETVAATTAAFGADFSMSRGIRSLPGLVRALRAESWDEITTWGITDFFCCVVPAPEARRHFGDSPATLADTAWAMSSRMQYNSWHFIAGNLPRTEKVLERDHFVPPTIPDIAHFSDQHHHGHVNNMVRFTIRSPHTVWVCDRPFDGFVDLRIVRADGEPYTEQEMLAAHQVAAFVARMTQQAVVLAEQGEQAAVTAFDSAWHWRTITGTPAPDAAPQPVAATPAQPVGSPAARPVGRAA